jgi:hypothetical protein
MLSIVFVEFLYINTFGTLLVYLYNKQMLVGNLVGWYAEWSFALKGFWAVWDNICECVFTTLDFFIILDGQFTSNT